MCTLVTTRIVTMPRHPDTFTPVTYETLAALTGQTIDVIRQHRMRGKFDPERLETILIYMSRYSLPELRRAMQDYALGINASDAPPVFKPKRTAKKA